jgi:lauroyl/myristoyl acyltransferase
MALMRVKDLYFLTVLILIRVIGFSRSVILRNRLVTLLGWIAFQISSEKRTRSLAGLQEGLGSSVGHRERERIALASFRMFWQDAFAILPLPGESRSLDHLPVEGRGLLETALKQGKGAILLESNSFGNRLLAKQVLHKQGFSLVQVHAQNHLHGLRNRGLKRSWLRESFINPTFEDWENEFLSDVVYLPEDDSLTFTRILQRLLAGNSIICSAGDGNRGKRMVRIPFLGRSRSFATGMFSLSRVSGAPVMPLFCYQDFGGQTRVTIGPIFKLDRIEKDRLAPDPGLSEYVAILENYVKKYPDQYRHWHF